MECFLRYSFRSQGRAHGQSSWDLSSLSLSLSSVDSFNELIAVGRHVRRKRTERPARASGLLIRESQSLIPSHVFFTPRLLLCFRQPGSPLFPFRPPLLPFCPVVLPPPLPSPHPPPPPDACTMIKVRIQGGKRIESQQITVGQLFWSKIVV